MKLTHEEARAVLEVSQDADASTVKSAFKRMALAHHPDKNEGREDSAEKFKRVGAAYAKLTDGQGDGDDDSEEGSFEEEDDDDFHHFCHGHFFARNMMDMFFADMFQDMMFSSGPGHFSFSTSRRGMGGRPAGSHSMGSMGGMPGMWGMGGPPPAMRSRPPEPFFPSASNRWASAGTSTSFQEPPPGTSTSSGRRGTSPRRSAKKGKNRSRGRR